MNRFLVTFVIALGSARGQRGASSGYLSPSNDGGIFQAGYISDNAEFGNTFSAQNAQPTYAAGGRGGGFGGGAAGFGGGVGGRGGGSGGRGSGAGADNIAMLEKAVPGIPGQDYPIYAEVPETSFTCDGQVDGGYYADTDAQCQVFHICTTDGQGGLTKYSFLCPNGTIFNQQYFICDWWFNFDCSEATGLYSLNEQIAAEREAATQALLASASNNQATYVGRNGGNQGGQGQTGFSSSPSRPSASAAPSGGYSSPAGGRGQTQAQSGGRKAPAGGNSRGAGRRGNGRGGQRGGAAAPVGGYGAPTSGSGSQFSGNAGFGSQGASQSYGAPQGGSNLGGSSSSAGTGYGAPSGASDFGQQASSGYGAPSSFSDNLPSYGK